MLIISLIIGAVLWVLYHKIFHVVYFGGTFQQILSEITVCIVLGFIIAIFGANILGVVLVVSIQVIGYLLLGAAIIFGIWLIYKIIKAIVIHVKKKRGTYVERTEENVEVTPDEAGASDNEESNTADGETVAEEKSSNILMLTWNCLTFCTHNFRFSPHSQIYIITMARLQGNSLGA